MLILIQILKLLKGETHVNDFVNFHGREELNDHDVDDIFPTKFMSKPSLSFVLRDIDYGCTSSSNAYTNVKKTGRMKLKEYLKKQQE